MRSLSNDRTMAMRETSSSCMAAAHRRGSKNGVLIVHFAVDLTGTIIILYGRYVNTEVVRKRSFGTLCHREVLRGTPLLIAASAGGPSVELRTLFRLVSRPFAVLQFGQMYSNPSVLEYSCSPCTHHVSLQSPSEQASFSKASF